MYICDGNKMYVIQFHNSQEICVCACCMLCDEINRIQIQNKNVQEYENRD